MLPYIDPECKKVLRAARKICEENNINTAEIGEISERTGYREFTVVTVAEFLENRGVIVIDEYGDGSAAGIHLTQLGRHYCRYKVRDFLKTVFFSVILPLIVSAISGALTTLLLQTR